MEYLILGEPLTHARLRSDRSHLSWNGTRQADFNARQYMRNTHDDNPLIDYPINISFVFAFPHKLSERRPVPPLHELIQYAMHVVTDTVVKDSRCVKNIEARVFRDIKPFTRIDIVRIA